MYNDLLWSKVNKCNIILFICKAILLSLRHPLLYLGLVLCVTAHTKALFLSDIDGEQMGKKESVWLGKILKNAGINFSDKGVSNEKLLEGSSDLTYEEVQFVLRENPKTHILSENLKEELQLRKSLIFNALSNLLKYTYLKVNVQM